MRAATTERMIKERMISIMALVLVEEIWDTIAEENQAFELTDAQKRELDRRLETARSEAGQAGAFGRTWEEIKAEFMKSR